MLVTPTSATGKLLGVVQVRVGPRSFAVPVQALALTKDGSMPSGGFFMEGDELGIFVDTTAPDVDEQIKRATMDAVRHLSLKVLD
jgi:hypothetical protein